MRGVVLWAFIGGLGIVLALGWLVLGTAGVAVMASTWLIGVVLSRVAPSLRGAACWACAIVVEFTAILGLSAVTAVIDPGPHGAVPYAVTLAVPGVAAVVLLVIDVARRGLRLDPEDTRLQAPRTLPVVIAGLVLAIFAWIGRAAGAAFDVAWAMSGDARNHVLIERAILADGGVTLHMLDGYPAAFNALAAVIAGAGGRDGAPGQLLLDDAHALASTYVLSAVAIAVLLAGAVLEATATLPRSERSRRAPWGIYAIALGAAAGALTPTMLGTALVDGFFSGYGALVPAIAALVLGLRFAAQPRARSAALVLTALAVGLTFISWTVLVCVPWAVLLLMTIRGIVGRWGRRGGPDAQGESFSSVALVIAMLAILGVAAVTVAFRGTFRVIFAYPGSISTPAGWMLPVLLLVSTAGVMCGGATATRRGMLIPTVAGVAGAITVLVLRTMADGPALGWTYYGAKTYWLVCCALFWVPFALAGAALLGSSDALRESRRRDGREATAGLAIGSALALAFGSATSLGWPIAAALDGWHQPSAATVTQVALAADSGRPFVFWRGGDSGDDRLANFWSALVWSSVDGEWAGPSVGDSSFPVWAYFQDESQVSQLCEVVEAVEDVVVYTEDGDLGAEVAAACPSAAPQIVTDAGGD